MLLPVALLAILAHQSHVPLALGLLSVAAAAIGWAQGAAGRRGPCCGESRRRRSWPSPSPSRSTSSASACPPSRPSATSSWPPGCWPTAPRWTTCGRPARSSTTGSATTWTEIPPGGTSFLWARPALWDAIGGHRAWNAEAGRIVRGTIAHDPLGVLGALAANGAAQFAALRTGESLLPWPEDDGPRPMIARFFPRELDAFDAVPPAAWPAAGRCPALRAAACADRLARHRRAAGLHPGLAA